MCLLISRQNILWTLPTPDNRIHLSLCKYSKSVIREIVANNHYSAGAGTNWPLRRGRAYGLTLGISNRTPRTPRQYRCSLSAVPRIDSWRTVNLHWRQLLLTLERKAPQGGSLTFQSPFQISQQSPFHEVARFHFDPIGLFLLPTTKWVHHEDGYDREETELCTTPYNATYLSLHKNDNSVIRKI